MVSVGIQQDAIDNKRCSEGKCRLSVSNKPFLRLYSRDVKGGMWVRVAFPERLFLGKQTRLLLFREN